MLLEFMIKIIESKLVTKDLKNDTIVDEFCKGDLNTLLTKFKSHIP